MGNQKSKTCEKSQQRKPIDSTLQMNGAAFPSPMAEMAEMNRIHYELEYTQGISQRMRVPEMLKVAPHHSESSGVGPEEVLHSVIMHVPERIVIAGESNNTQFHGPRDLDLIQSTPFEALSLRTPPRVLTLNEGPLEFLEDHQASQGSEELLRPQVRSQRERSVSENAALRNSIQLVHNDTVAPSSSTTSPPPTAHPCPPDAAAQEHNLYSPSSVLSFIQSTTRRAYQQVLEVLDENPRSKPSLRGGSASCSNPQHDSRLALSTFDATMDGTADDMTVVDATALRRQLVKLNRRLQHLEEENKERTRREVLLYSLSVAFWLVNTWVWLRR